MRHSLLALALFFFSLITSCVFRPQMCNKREVSCQTSVTIHVAKFGDGSGVVISTDGFIVTDAHVIGEVLERTITVRYETDGQVSQEQAVLVAIDYQLDLALLWVPKQFPQVAPFGSSDKLRRGSTLYAISTPEGIYDHSFTPLQFHSRGIFWSDFDKVIPKLQLKPVAKGIAPGSSGGGIFDSQGSLVGLIQRLSENRKLVYAIPVETVRRFINTTRSSSAAPNACLPQ